MPTVVDLGEAKKRQRPGAYDDMDSTSLGRAIKAKFPGQYDDFAESAPVTNGIPLDAKTGPIGFQPSYISPTGGGVFGNQPTLHHRIPPDTQISGAPIMPLDAMIPTAVATGLSKIDEWMRGSPAPPAIHGVPIAGGPVIPSPTGAFTENAEYGLPTDRNGLRVSMPRSVSSAVKTITDPEFLSEIPGVNSMYLKPKAALISAWKKAHATAVPPVPFSVLNDPRPSYGPELPPPPVLRDANSPAWAGFPEPASPPLQSVEPIPATTTPRGAVPGGPQNIPLPVPPPMRWTPPPEYRGILPTPLEAPASVESIPAAATPRGAVPGGIQNQSAAPLPIRIVGGGARFNPSVPPDLPPVRPIQATESLSGRTIPSVEERIARANSPSVSPEESLANIQAFTGKLKRGAKDQTFVQSNAGVTVPSPILPKPLVATPPPIPGKFVGRTTGNEIPASAGGFYGPGFGIYDVPIEKVSGVEDISGMPDKTADIKANADRIKAGSPIPPLFGNVDDQGTVQVEGARRLAAAKAAGQKTVPVAIQHDYQAPTPSVTPVAGQQSGLLQNLIKTVQSSQDANAEAIAEHAGGIGHTLTTNKNAVMANHLLGQGIDADKWSALPMGEKQAWVKKINAAQKTKYKPFGSDFRPGGYGRPAEEGARQVEDALRVLGAQSSQ